MKAPRGFTFAGFNAGIKPSRKDLALVHSATPCVAAGCFTVNKARAAPVLEAERRLPARGIHSIIVNSGNANALTGPAGLEDVEEIKRALAKALGTSPASVLTASTGVIGVRLPVHKVVAAIPQLVEGLRPDPTAAAEAIMTTDTRVKMASRTLEVGGVEVSLAAICKGSGMIAPQLATMIAALVTDCEIAPELLSGALREAMETSFNCLTVDNDMSTNDVVFALANGQAGNAPIARPGPELERFTAVLTDLCQELAREIAADGEGATKMFEVTVSGAPDRAVAVDLARSIAGSSLVKAALFGADPNWGRILATVGARAGSQRLEVDPYRSRVRIQGVLVYAGAPAPHDSAALKARMRAPEVRVEVELEAGDARAVAWGCDLSYDYVKINADYTSLIVQAPDGGVAKDDRLSNYSPAFKVSLLVEALSYISRFSGRRCVIKLGGATMAKESLKHSFCGDVILLRSVGLQPIVVHDGGAEVVKALEELGGGRASLVSGVRIPEQPEPRLLDVLTGAINAELVTLLNRDGGHAVGVSGKDGGLLRARRTAGPGDEAAAGEITGVNRELLEVLLKQGYVPVISPTGMSEGGQGCALDANAVAAQVAAALGATKLIFLTGAPGILDRGELLSELTAEALERLLEREAVMGGMARKARAILDALRGGVERVHVLDGRTPHGVIAELFTDRGIGSLVTAR